MSDANALTITLTLLYKSFYETSTQSHPIYPKPSNVPEALIDGRIYSIAEYR
jgi:hypothetical protein